LSSYFSDVDYSDTVYNQTVNFSVISNSSSSLISYSVNSNWSLTLSASTTVSELLNITGNDSEFQAQSNSFTVTFTTPPTTPQPTAGGGGSSRKKPVSLKIIVPDPISAYKGDIIKVPISLVNTGKTDLYKINLSSIIVKNMTIREDINMYFDETYFSSLKQGQEENTTLTIEINTDDPGLHEITVNATVKDPEYSDWGKLYLTVKSVNETDLLEKIIFTEELIVENPECIELSELIEEAKEYYERGNYKEASDKTEEALQACRASIAQQSLPSPREDKENNLFKYLSITTLSVFGIGLVYYFYRRVQLSRFIIKS
jgi:hypothetical protein